MTNDDRTTVAQLRAAVANFVAEREWQQFHSPKNLSMSIAIEAAELMERFQWRTDEQIRVILNDESQRLAIEEEISDVLSYLLAMANVIEMDVSEALADKMEKNSKKYPANQFRGRFGPEDT
ncbi:MAG: nucleotide pyrophosphohydrolase [Planctomycetales bacterium]|nr:nucleotide pyrophosphohydrolase [Planctomycetales bacterium]